MKYIKNKKHILIALSSFLILFFLIWAFIFFSKKEDKISFTEEVVKTTSYEDSQKKSLSSSWNIVENPEDMNKIYSLTRSICSAFDDYSLAVKSRYFTMLKKEITLLNEKHKDDSFEFMYVIVPGAVYKSCSTKDPEFNEKIVYYLQSEWEVVNLELEKNIKEELWVYIDELAFIDMDTIDKLKIKTDKKYFDDYFFVKNKEELISLFYPYYIKEGRNVSNFLNKPSNTLNEEVEFKNKLMTVMLLNLKLIGFNDIEEFKNITKSNYWVNDIEEFKWKTLAKYKRLESKLLSEKSIDLKSKMANINEFKKFIESNEYKKIFEDPANTKLINEIWKEMTIFTILSNDYADWLNETWSWKEFFWDEESWNNLIRLNFVYILSLNSDWAE